MSEGEIPRRSLLDLFTRIDNLLELNLKISRRTNELLEMLLGVRPAAPKVPALPIPPVPISQLLDVVEEMLKPVTDYLSESKAAPISPKRKEYDLMKELKRPALNGYIANDGAGDIKVKINKLAEIEVKNGEILDLNAYTKRPLEINYIEVKAVTAANYRILLW